jgi:hypothetical protein
MEPPWPGPSASAPAAVLHPLIHVCVMRRPVLIFRPGGGEGLPVCREPWGASDRGKGLAFQAFQFGELVSEPILSQIEQEWYQTDPLNTYNRMTWSGEGRNICRYQENVSKTSSGPGLPHGNATLGFKVHCTARTSLRCVASVSDTLKQVRHTYTLSCIQLLLGSSVCQLHVAHVRPCAHALGSQRRSKWLTCLALCQQTAAGGFT